MQDTDTEWTTERHSLWLRDVCEGRLVATYSHVRTNTSCTDAKHVSARLPAEMAVLFDGGTLDPEALTDEERAWIEADTRIEFAEVAL